MNQDRVKKRVLAILIVVAIGQWLVLPLSQAVEARRQLLEQYEETMANRKVLLSRYQRQQEVLTQTSKDQNTLSRRLYVKEAKAMGSQLNMLKHINTEAGKVNLDVINFELSHAVKRELATEIPVLVRLKGSIKNIVALLEQLDHAEKFMLVKMLRIKKSRPGYVVTLEVFGFRSEIESAKS